MKTHRKLTIAGVILLAATILINYYHQADHPDVGFNYAYATGITMLAVLLASFIIFTKQNLKQE
ncbi:MAG: hypothetical protein ACR2LL_05385 [Nitrosopumilus sp.]